MSHALPGLVAEARCDQFVVAPHRAIEEDRRGAREPSPEIVGYTGTRCQKIHMFAARSVADSESKRVAVAIVARGVSLALQVPRAFARYGKWQDLDAGRRAIGQGRFERSIHLDRPALHVLLVQHVEDAVGRKYRQHPGVGIDRKWRALAHRQ